jgi:hypothetical protein
MSILYCAIFHNKQKKKLVEYPSENNFQMQIKSLLTEIFKNTVNDRLPFEQYFLTYTRSKEIIYLCVSPKKLGDERPRVFLDFLINKLNSRDYDISAEPELKINNIKELALQGKYKYVIDNQINSFNSGLENSRDPILEIQNNIKETQNDLRKATAKITKNISDLNEELLVTSEKLKDNGNDFKKNANKVEGDTRCCCKPWVICTSITLGIILFLAIIYLIVAFIRCNNFNAFCET